MTIQNRMAYITALNIDLFLVSLHRASHFVRHILCVTRNTNKAASLCGGGYGGRLPIQIKTAGVRRAQVADHRES